MVHTSYDNQVYGVAASSIHPSFQMGKRLLIALSRLFVKLVFFVFNLNGSVVCL